MICSKCNGCGQVADTQDEELWTMWLNLPVQSATAMMSGLVKPKRCPKCGGEAGIFEAPCDESCGCECHETGESCAKCHDQEEA